MMSSKTLKTLMQALLLFLLSATVCNAQLVEAYSVKAMATCTQYVYAYDAENPTLPDNSVLAYVDGCTAIVMDIPTAQKLYTLDLSAAGLDKASSIALYRNLLAHDGKYTAIATYYKAPDTGQTALHYDSYLYNGTKTLIAQNAKAAAGVVLSGMSLAVNSCHSNV